MGALARWSYRRRWVVVVSWVVGLVALTGVGTMIGTSYSSSQSLPGTDSQAAVDLLQREFPSQSGETDTIVWSVPSGSVRDRAVRARVEPMLSEVAGSANVAGVGSPYAAGGAAQISPDGRVAFATVTFDARGDQVPTPSVEGVIARARALDGATLHVNLGGQAIAQTEQASLSTSELIGVVGAAIVLFVAFGSLMAMLLPLASAIAGLAAGLAGIGFLSHAMGVADFSTQLAILIGLGVGIDYALFIVSRHRTALRQGRTPEQAVATALDTSGRAVLFAGATVCIALLGLFALGVSFLNGVALAIALTVALTVVSSITLLPALLGFLGMRALSRRERRGLAASGPAAEAPSGLWARWAGVVQRRRVLLAVAATALMVALAIPFFSLRMGSSDAGNNSTSTTTRQAYDQLAAGFGPGFNGPLQLAAQLGGPDDRAALTQVAEAARQTPGVAEVGAIRLSPGGTAAVFEVYPTTSPQSEDTANLLNTLRDDVIPQATAESGLVVHVGGQTATAADFSSVLSSKLPLFIGVVVGLSLLLLMVAFRSLLIPAVAAVMNLLSVAAAFGVIVAVFQWGWAADLIGVGQTGPIEAFIPVFVFAILFGLSTDYQVFLVGRMREAWVTGAGNHRAVRDGLAATGRVITAAATIMVLVFGSFVLGDNRVLKLFGLGLAVAILLDALIVRTILVPAVMHILGRANWWIPAWLDRILPRVSIEGGEAARPTRRPGDPPTPALVPQPSPTP
ncbi:MAG: putative drug exporter of the superfamily [Miltoncostaeaceae bacterium]|nr:putative drug exporter of the superfamily [Miltoncostaeaceae bacterium]